MPLWFTYRRPAMPALQSPYPHSLCLAMLVHGDELLPFAEAQ
jgi:hypothetical protein